MKVFKSIIEFQKEFDTDEKCREYLEQQRWNGEPCCPFCGSVNVHRFATNNKIFKCREKGCRNKFSVTVGTIYENTKIPLVKWFYATYLLAVHSKGISSLQLGVQLGITTKSAWHLSHRIREMLTDKNPQLLNGMVECDETYVGGKLANKHQKQRKHLKSLDNKTMVFGAVERGGKVKTKVLPSVDVEHIQQAIFEAIQPNSTMVTDEHKAYKSVSKHYDHHSINHRDKEYVRGFVHTNTIEGYWNILKKQIVGIHHFVSPKHLQRYCNESAFRYNRKNITQDERFAETIANCNGRLKYNDLIAKKA